MARSRYPRVIEEAVPGRGVRTRARPGPDGAEIRYLGRRILPLPEALGRSSGYTVRAGDRIDLVAWRLLGDPTLWWLLAEANGAGDPAELCAVPGRRLAVPAPLGQAHAVLDHPRGGTRTAAAAPVAHAHDGDETP